MSPLVDRLPNYLTCLRLALIPLLVVLMIDPSPAMRWGAIFVFIIAAITDYVDGYLARRYSAVSDFGKLLDPLADKILVMAVLVMLVSLRSDLDGEPWVPGWMVVVVLAREIWVTGLRAVAASKGIIVAAGSVGKVKSGFQMFAVVLLLLHEKNLVFFGYAISCQLIGLNLLLISIAFSIWSAFEYSVQILAEDKPSSDQVVREISKPSEPQLPSAQE